MSEIPEKASQCKPRRDQSLRVGRPSKHQRLCQQPLGDAVICLNIAPVDGQAIDQNHDLSGVIEMHQPGQTVTLSIFRAGQNLTLHVKLAARPKNM